MICLTMGYPNPEDEIAILKGKSAGDPLNDVMKVMDGGISFGSAAVRRSRSMCIMPFINIWCG